MSGLALEKCYSCPPGAFLHALSRDDLTDLTLNQVRCLSHALSPHLGLDDSCVVSPEQAVDGLLCFMENDFRHCAVIGRPTPWTALDESCLPRGHKLVTHREEWLRQTVDLREIENGGPGKRWRRVCFQEPDGESVTFYHGTTALVAHLLCRSGGFIPGPNGHTKAKTHYKGCFGSTDFNTAKQRGDQTRNLDYEKDMIYTFSNCPVVLELRAQMANIVNYKKSNPHLLVVPGRPGAFLPGISVMAIHWNHRFVKNYRALQDPEVRDEIRQVGGVFQACCGGLRQYHDFQSCGAWSRDPWTEFVKLGKHYVCRRCEPLWRPG